ncbi:MAG: sigma-70 family RNA polymerase sigma factor [Bacteroidales bacterium]|jgi:RNA polymerase sigma-70 factor (TIGR02943 family)|nr:sigma-70 family RNA polymerase sigma factor [Bacteroidales bacterium]
MSEQKNALSEWVETYTQQMYKWAYHKVSDSEMAKDLVQDTFLAAAEKISSFKGESSPKTWLFSILNYKIIDHYRRKVKQPQQMENQSFEQFFTSDGDWIKNKQPRDWSEDSENLLDNPTFLAVLKECLDALPEQWSTCVKLKYLMNKKGDEICQEVEISTTNYWQIVHRAKLQLRECVENKWFKN